MSQQLTSQSTPYIFPSVCTHPILLLSDLPLSSLCYFTSLHSGRKETEVLWVEGKEAMQTGRRDGTKGVPGCAQLAYRAHSG